MRFIRLYKRIWQYLAEYYGKLLVSIGAMIIAALTDAVFAHIMKPLIDKGFVEKNPVIAIYTPLAIMGIFLIRMIASYINDYISSWLSNSIVEKMRNIVFRHLQILPVNYYSSNSSGRIISRIIFDITQITEAGFNVITILFRDGVTVVSLICLMFYINWQLTIVCMLALPLILLLIRKLSSKIRALTSANQEQYGSMTQIINEVVHGYKIIKLFAGHDYENARFSKAAADIKSNNVKQASIASLNSGISQFLVSCALSVIVYVATMKSVHVNLTAGEFVSFVTALSLMFAPVKRITMITQSIQRGVTAAESVFTFLDTASEIDAGQLILHDIRHDIVFSDVYFKYGNNSDHVLRGINFAIKRGETVAFVGASGSGKTTCMNLIPRFFLPTAGSIAIDGTDIGKLSLLSLRDKIALVSQEIVLFNDTIFNNIIYGAPTSDQRSIVKERVFEAAKLAHCMEFIDRLPHGFDTAVGENGVKLSGGQKQRIAIARAFYKQAPILLLDEATSSLDLQAEQSVQRALDNLLGSASLETRTTIIIAHRLSTVVNADKILVFVNGAIVESGNHFDLIKLGGHYAHLQQAQ